MRQRNFSVARPSDGERRLRHRLRDGQVDGLKFRRQVPIGGAVAEIVCHERRPIVERDGGRHADSASDARRDAALKRMGFHVLSFRNTDASLNPEGVLETILSAARSLPAYPGRVVIPQHGRHSSSHASGAGW